MCASLKQNLAAAPASILCAAQLHDTFTLKESWSLSTGSVIVGVTLCDGGGCFVLWGGEQCAVQGLFTLYRVTVEGLFTGIRSVAAARGTGSLPVLCFLLCD